MFQNCLLHNSPLVHTHMCHLFLHPLYHQTEILSISQSIPLTSIPLSLYHTSFISQLLSVLIKYTITIRNTILVYFGPYYTSDSHSSNVECAKFRCSHHHCIVFHENRCATPNETMSST